MWHRILKAAAPLHELPVWARFLGATLLVAAGFGARLAFDATLFGYPFLVLLPSIILSAALFNSGTGMYATALSTGLAVYFFIEPVGSFTMARTGDVVATIAFVLVALMTASLIEALRTALIKVAVARDNLEEAHRELSRAHDETAAAERRQNLLFRELSHRVRNDLQMLSALTHFDLRSVTDADARRVLSDVEARLRVMGRVHTRLTTQDNGLVTESDAVLAELCADLKSALIGNRPIALWVEAEAHGIPLDRAGALALIVNELTTNALKHAFPEDGPGTVRVTFKRVGDEFHLTVADDGQGIKSAPSSSGVGGRLVEGLAAQIGGALNLQRGDPGTRWLLRFPADPRQRTLSTEGSALTAYAA